MNAIIPDISSADILIVDDNPYNVELLETLLDEEGYLCCESFTDPYSAEARVLQQVPDLILLDVRMPGMSGFQLMERLQQVLSKPQMPAIIFLTAQVDEQTRYQALQLGAQDFITKPFDHVEVLQRLHNTLQLRLLLRERSEKADQLEHLVTQRTAELRSQSREDPVTLLPNRRGLLELLAEQIQYQAPVSVYFIALEGLDEIARLHGYGVADLLSKAVAARMLNQLGAEQTLGVWNSSEWLLLAPGMDQGTDIAHQLLQLFQAPFRVETMALRLRVRIGVSSNSESCSAQQLVRMAALALAPEEGRWRRYDAGLEQALLRRKQIQDALALALENNEFHLVFQPKVDVENGRFSSAEALLRWQNSTLGAVSPAEFIPLAEAGGEVVQIGDWVVDRVIEYLNDWRGRGLVGEDFSLAVNVASVQLMQPRFAERLVQRVLASGLPPGALEVEVTESGLMEDIELAMTQLEVLAAAGIRIAIDDFGTGYSSLAYLKTLPVSVLKIDRAFIRELHNNIQDQRLTETVIAMARHFECKTVAEGVELPEQLSMLTRMGCDQVQGFLFAPPLKEAAMLKMVRLGFDHLFTTRLESEPAL
ncbi:hypothetical protein GCM10009104_22990 [Marinobacterium maritimum]|uniref:Diguanylate cyclase (GGDEF) domain-containing protein n=1 Tax=Marinobacterium maritimum TaxID=500162 RepID=A0ABP3TCR6_9GAMM